MASAPTLMLALHVGGSLRFSARSGFYVVLSGKTVPVRQAEARAAVKAGRVRHAGIHRDGSHAFELAPA